MSRRRASRGALRGERGRRTSPGLRAAQAALESQCLALSLPRHSAKAFTFLLLMLIPRATHRHDSWHASPVRRPTRPAELDPAPFSQTKASRFQAWHGTAYMRWLVRSSQGGGYSLASIHLTRCRMYLLFTDIKDNLSIYDLARPDPTIRATAFANPHASSSASFGSAQHGPPHPDTPLRIAVHSVRNVVMCIELSPSFDHLFLGLRDGTVDTYDLDRFCVSPYRVPNLWWEE